MVVSVCVIALSYIRHDVITTHLTNISQHEMMVSWHDTTVLRLDTIISCCNTMSFHEGIIIVISSF